MLILFLRYSQIFILEDRNLKGEAMLGSDKLESDSEMEAKSGEYLDG